MKELSPFSTDQYTPLLCLWGIKSLKHKGGFCIKSQTMVHKTFFSLTFLPYSLYFLLHFFFAFPFNFPLLEEGEELLNEARNACRSQKGRKKKERAREKKQSYSNFSFRMFSFYSQRCTICVSYVGIHLQALRYC